jgi:hypothetical protein
MLVPEVALLRDLAGTYVLVVDDENIVQRRDVQLGSLIETERIIASGLEADDRIIVKGIQRAIPGNPVSPQAAAPAESRERPAVGESSAPPPPPEGSSGATARSADDHGE